MEFQKLIVQIIPENIKISYNLEEDLSPIHADDGQLEQVLMNLVINVRDAMLQGGELIISTDNIRLDKPLESHWQWKNAGYFVSITISDTGIGMDEDIISRVYEPFYSTKGSQGNGLGLSMVYGKVQQYGGYISLISQVGQGTQF